MKIRGTQCKTGDCVLEGEIPVFGKVLGIAMKTKEDAVLAAETLRTMCYVEHFHAYQVAACLTKTYNICIT